MKMLSLTRVVGFGAAIAALTGCGEAVGPNIPGIDVTISLSQEEMAVGDTIEIRIVATNTTAGPLTFATNTCVLVVRILDRSNTPVIHLPGFCNDIRLEHTLGPGESLMGVELFDGTIQDPLGRPGERSPLESGTYRVFAGISSDALNPSDAVKLCIQP